METNYLGPEIQKLRKEKGMTQEELAHKSGLSTRTIQRIESGEVDARTYTLGMIAEALDVPIEYFTADKSGKELAQLQKRNYNRKWLALLHISGLFTLLIPPIVIFLLKRDEVEGMEEHGRDVLNFQLSMWVYLFVCGVPPMLIIGIFFLPVLGIMSTIYVVLNSVRVMNDSEYHYPLTIKFIKPRSTASDLQE